MSGPDRGGREHSQPVTVDQAGALARELYGIVATPRPVQGGCGTSFLLDVTGVPAYLLAVSTGRTKPAPPAQPRTVGSVLAQLARAVEELEPTPVRTGTDLTGAGVPEVGLGADDPDPAHRRQRADLQDRLRVEVRPGPQSLRRWTGLRGAGGARVEVGAGGQVCALVALDRAGDAPLVRWLATAAAAAVGDSRDPLADTCELVVGFHANCPLDEAEVDVLWELIRAGHLVTTAGAAAAGVLPVRAAGGSAPWGALDQTAGIHHRLARYRLRDACGLPAHPAGEQVREYLATCPVAPLLAGIAGTTVFGVDLSAGSATVRPADAAAAPSRFDALIWSVVGGDTQAVGVGGYGEDRLIYTSAAFAGDDPAGDAGAEPRTVHLGIDVWTHPGREVFAPLAGTVVVAHDNAARLDYGPVVVLEHRTDADVAFYTLYGHLARRTLDHVRVGAVLAGGDRVGWVGTPPSNGDWAPHVHVQVILDLLDLAHDYPGVCRASQRSAWLGLSPDPQLITRLTPRGWPGIG